LFVILLAMSFGLLAQAGEQTFAPVLPFVDAEAFLIGRLDVQKLSIQDVQTRVAAIAEKITGDASSSQVVATAAQQPAQMRDAFLQAGGREVFVVVSTADIPARSPLIVVTCSEPAKLAGLQKLVEQLASMGPEEFAVEKQGDRTLLVGPTQTVQRVRSMKPATRGEVSAAALASGDSPLQVLVTPSANQRRVLTETMPDFPAPFNQITGPVVSEGIQWAIASFDVAPTLKVNLQVESKDAAAAERLQKTLVAALQAISLLPPVQEALPDSGAVLKLLEPKLQAKRLAVTISEDEQTLQTVAKPLVSAIASARASAQRTQSMNNLKQIGLAFHNYHDVYKKFPSNSVDANGKPLLSWRVHILPYIDQQVLYNQFKLDEPWDSEHNKKLSEIVVAVYRDPSAELKPGTTTYLMPNSAGTIGGQSALRFQDILDGTSNTLMVVNAAPERAVIWTKPDDLTVTQENPFAGITTATRKKFEAALCDGSVRVISDATDPKTLWLLFQINDRTPIDYDTIK
jgi:hypothetical protein